MTMMANLKFSTSASSHKRVDMLLWPWTTTRNSDMTAETGNSYNSGTKTDSVEIPTATPGFLTMASPNNVSPSDCDSDRQPEILTWPTKPEVLIFPTVWQISVQLRSQTWHFSTGTNSQQGLTCGCDTEQQPEVATWLPKPEIVITLELQHITLKF